MAGERPQLIAIVTSLLSPANLRVVRPLLRRSGHYDGDVMHQPVGLNRSRASGGTT
jgi:hypothetical protein